MRTRFAGTQLSSYLDSSNFDNIAKSSMEARATERNADMISKAYVEQADITGDAKVKAAKYGASATVAQGAAKGQSAMFSGLASGIGSIAGGFAKRPGAGETPGIPTGNTGNTKYGLGGGAGQGELLAPLSTGDNATGLLNSFLQRD